MNSGPLVILKLKVAVAAVTVLILASLVLPEMYVTGRPHRRWLHVSLAVVFGVLWAGTFVTGVFFLPHSGTP